MIEIPPEIAQLPNLMSLWLHNNQLSNIPPEFARLNKLHFLILRENPHLKIPPEILERADNPQVILDYLSGQQDTSPQPLNEARIILVGQGSVGKTSLIKRLVENIFDPHEEQTKGIHIEKWELNVPRPEQGIVPITLNLWDFGGQEIMHATHQFFLTKRCLYLLVLDAWQEAEDGRVEYWLSLINSFAPDAPILIIVNKIDQQSLDVDRRGLQKKYPAIKGFIPTSARDNIGIDKLKRAIVATLVTMPHIDSPFPTNWMQIKEALRAMQTVHNFIPYDDYQKLCLDNGVIDQTKQATLIAVLKRM